MFTELDVLSLENVPYGYPPSQLSQGRGLCSAGLERDIDIGLEKGGEGGARARRRERGRFHSHEACLTAAPTRWSAHLCFPVGSAAVYG